METSVDKIKLEETKEKILSEIDRTLEQHNAPTTVLWLKALREVNFQIRRLK